jgi:hypothetical protein
MCFGFACLDGWSDLIDGLSQALTPLILEQPEDEREQFRAFQVKEKFGGLRFYLRGDATDAMADLIEHAERASWSICEVCGAPGRRRGRSWIVTRCDEHAPAWASVGVEPSGT